MNKTGARMVWAAACMLTVSPLAASASQLVLAGPNHWPSITPNDLEAAAEALFETPARYDEAALLYVEAAEMRQIGDPVRVRDLIMASRLTYYINDIRQSLVLMDRAAEEALATGDVVTAAHSFLDASCLAREISDTDTALEMARKAELLSFSPLIATADRQKITSRFANGA